ncbi:MAG: hypothetical protein I8H87_03875 [Comamonadaceae bacterium]|nr:hypothetical protein [Comamonadaceae bacterium]
MVHLYRLIIAAVLIVLSVAASAAIQPVVVYSFSNWQGTPSEIIAMAQSNSPMTGCISGGSVPNTWYSKNITASSFEIWLSRPACPGYSPFDAYQFTANAISIQCPVNSTSVSGSCVCNSGFIENGGACVGSTPDQSFCHTQAGLGTIPGGFLVQNYRYSGNVADGSTFCVPMDGMSSPDKGCKVTFSRDSFLDYGGGNSITEGTLSMSSDSYTVDQSCTVGTGDTPAPPAKETCKDGFSGTVNGVTVCISKVPDNGIDGDSETETVNDGTNTTETIKKTDTVCTDGKCTTTTTTTTTTTNNSTGNVTTNTTTSSSTSEKDGFCKEKPESELCQDGGGEFAGSCEEGFTCEGDAIQCAIAREQHIRACKLFDDESPESKLYEDNKGKEGKQTGDLPGNETVNVSGRIDSSDALGAGSSGVADLNVTVWGTSVTLPFSMLNPYLAALGNVLLAVSFLIALRIVARG